MLGWPAVGWILLAVVIVAIMMIMRWRLRRAGDTLRNIVEDEFGSTADTSGTARTGTAEDAGEQPAAHKQRPAARV
jgi:hypothetical protein